MFIIDLKNRKPIYEQVVDNFKRLIVSGRLETDARVPSIRELAKDLGINPNTVQKAYRQLEGEGFLYAVSGQGSFVAAVPAVGIADFAALDEAVTNLAYNAVVLDNILQRTEKIYNEVRSNDAGS